MTISHLRRRAVLRGLLASACATSQVRAAGLEPRDQGIGGTGVAAPPPDDSDRGIGGTGVIGTIRRFGSIVVNGLRIAYPEDVRVTIDGQPASLADVRLGQVVSVAATGAREKLATREIVVEHEIVGPVQSVDGKMLRILGQSVVVEGRAPAIQSGDWVAVSGLRRLDGTVVASLVEPATPGIARVLGPAVSRGDGISVGGLQLAGAGIGLGERRVLVEGALQNGVFAPSSVSAQPLTAGLGNVRNVSIETYATRAGDQLRLGSGASIDGAARVRAAEGRSFITARLGPDGMLTAQRAAPSPVGGFDRYGPQTAPPGRPGLGGGPGTGGPGGGSQGGRNGIEGPGRAPAGGMPKPSGETTPGRGGALPVPAHSGAAAPAGFGQPAGGFRGPAAGPGAFGTPGPIGPPGGFGGPARPGPMPGRR